MITNNDFMKKQFVFVFCGDGERILNNIITDLNNKWLKIFDETDSVYIFKLSSSCEVHKFGYAVHNDEDFIIID